jgi:zinc/manganese transport system substrate-binding protein
MKKLLLIISIIFSFQNANAKDFGAVKIFACEPEWGALAQEIVGKSAVVVIATNQFQNPHFIQAKPSLIADIRRADIVFCSGSDLEIGWLPTLLERGGNKEIQLGGNGYLMASDYVKKL